MSKRVRPIVKPLKVIEAWEIPEDYDVSRFVGEEYRRIFNLVFKTFYYQFREGVRRGIKGFLFYGEPGTGKTSLAYAVVRELSKKFRNVYLVFVDASDIARPLYGESEMRIVEIFDEARSRAGYTVLLFDDVESIFMSRGRERIESWHIAQDNVFFHMLDELDTSRMGIIATTNWFELVDKALVDRLYPVEFKPLDLETALAIARRRCMELGVRFEKVEEEIRAMSLPPRSVREVERIVIKHYIEKLERLEIS
ncbi:MAG: ATP-binding protein [Desulfurococcaceae archaeon]|nr:ATP-binding protein [Desulfurococcaceae archaeon]